jgi:hypothetical protein
MTTLITSIRLCFLQSAVKPPAPPTSTHTRYNAQIMPSSFAARGSGYIDDTDAANKIRVRYITWRCPTTTPHPPSPPGPEPSRPLSKVLYHFIRFLFRARTGLFEKHETRACSLDGPGYARSMRAPPLATSHRTPKLKAPSKATQHTTQHTASSPRSLSSPTALQRGPSSMTRGLAGPSDST